MEFAGLPWFVWVAVLCALFSGPVTLLQHGQGKRLHQAIAWGVLAGGALVLIVFAVMKVF